MDSLIDSLELKVKHCLSLAEQQYQRKFNYQAINIDIRGRAAGQIRYELSRKLISLPVLRFNPYLLTQYKDVFIEQVVPHECAHLVAYQLYGMKIKPHGVEWKTQMTALYGLVPSVTHTFEVPQKARRTFDYLCACKNTTHHLTAIRHNKIRRETARYICKSCGTALAEV